MTRWSTSGRELTLLAVVLLATACSGHARPRVVGHYLVYGRGDAIVVAHADGSGGRVIAHGRDAVVSPDGRWVAFDVVRGTGLRLFVVSTAGGKPRPLSLTSSWPVWSPSSDRVATLKGDALVTIDLRGHVKVLDRSPDSGGGGWVFSRDGRSLLFTTDNGLAVVGVTGAGRHRLTRGAVDISPVWGPGWIAFTREGSIWSIRPDGGGLGVVLRAPPHPERTGIWGYDAVAWTPNGNTLLAQIVTPHAWDVGIRVDVATRRFTRVHGYPVGLSRDGRFALVFGGRPTGGPGGGRLPPEWIAAVPFGHSGRRRVLARGDVCCPRWNR